MNAPALSRRDPAAAKVKGESFRNQNSGDPLRNRTYAGYGPTSIYDAVRKLGRRLRHHSDEQLKKVSSGLACEARVAGTPKTALRSLGLCLPVVNRYRPSDVP